MLVLLKLGQTLHIHFLSTIVKRKVLFQSTTDKTFVFCKYLKTVSLLHWLSVEPGACSKTLLKTANLMLTYVT